MKKRRILRTALIILAALLLLLILVVLFWLGPTVKLVAETVGSKALGTPVRIENLSINPRKGLIHLSGFTIANQANYGQSNAVSLAGLDITFDAGSIFAQTVTVHQIQINSPHFVFEQSSASDNIAEYIQSIEEFIDYDPNAPPTPKDEKKAQKKRDRKEKKRQKREGKPPRIVVIQSLEINDVQFRLAHTDDPQLDIMVGIDQLSISMTNGITQVKNIQVNNPGRLQSKDLFSLDKIHIAIDPATIYRPPLSILEIQVINPHAFVEWAYDASTVSEFLYIADSTQARITEWPLPKKDPATEPEEEKTEAIVETEAKRPPPEIHHIGISNVQFHVVNSIDTNLTVRLMLDALNIGLHEGTADFDRFTVTNPRRLVTPNLFSLDGIDIRFDPATIHSNTLTILDVQVRKPHAFLESRPETDTVAEFMKIADTITGNLPTNRAAKASVPSVEETSPAPQADIPDAPPIELHNLLIDDIQVKLLDTTKTNAPADLRMLAGINSISVKLVDRELQVSGITIPNPPGFHATNLFHLAGIDITADPESTFSDQLVITEVFINSPKIHLEQTDTTGNFAELQKSLMAFTPPAPEAPAPEPDEIPAVDATNAPVPLAEQPVVFEALLVTNLAVKVILPPPPDPAATNEPVREAVGKVEVDFSKLNPMTHMQKSKTNGTEAVQAEEIPLLNFGLLTVKPLEGTIGISDLQVGNPPGFANKHLVKIQQFELSLDPDSLLTETLLIKEILIEEPSIAYERQITTDNMKTFQQTLEAAFARREEVMDKAEEEYDVETDVEGEKVIIEYLLVENGTVRAKISALPTAPIPLPPIEMKDVGKEKGGASWGEASSEIFNSFYDSIIGVVANTTGIATDALKGAGSFTLDAFGNVTGSLGGLVGLDKKDEAEEEPEKSEPEKPEPEEEKKKRGVFRRRIFPR